MNVFEEVKSNPQGLSSAEASKRAEQYGKNKLAEANNQKVKLSKPKKKDNIVDIREYLEIQKNIILSA